MSWFSLIKQTSDITVGFDTEKYHSKKIEQYGITYIVYSSNDDMTGIVWNVGNWIYTLRGNISESELLHIAKCTN